MKAILAAIVFSLASSAHATRPDVVEYCQVMGQMAGAIMKARQKGLPMSSMMPKPGSKGEFDSIIVIMVTHAYAESRYSSEVNQVRAIQDFTNEAERACFSANR